MNPVPPPYLGAPPYYASRQPPFNPPEAHHADAVSVAGQWWFCAVLITVVAVRYWS